MLQIDTRPYASDALEDAMRLAQTKSLNSFTFSDCFNYLNYAWSDIYNRMAQIEAGYYSTTVKLTSKLTHLPPFVKSSIVVYSAQRPIGYNREVFRTSGNTDLQASGTFSISGNDLYCPDAERRPVWLEYVPAAPLLFFTHHNRDPKILTDVTATMSSDYGLYTLMCKTGNAVKKTTDCTSDELAKAEQFYLLHKGTGAQEDISEHIIREYDDEMGNYEVAYISCAFPYIFISYKHTIGEGGNKEILNYTSGFLTRDMQWNQYNPFAFTGKKSNVEYLECEWNDKTGMGVIIKDHDDLDEDGNPIIKQLGWTPDTQLDYPIPEMYRYLVARLADKFSALNESNVMGVQKELAEAKYAFEAYFDKNKAAWKRINNVNPATINDWLV